MPAATFAFYVQKCDTLSELWIVLEKWSEKQPFYPAICHSIVCRYHRQLQPKQVEYSTTSPEKLDSSVYQQLLQESLLGDLSLSSDIAFHWNTLRDAESLAGNSLDKFDSLFPAVFKRLVFAPANAPDGNTGLFAFIMRKPDEILTVSMLAELELRCQYVYRRIAVLNRQNDDVRLSPRELEIASRIASGKSNRLIATELGVSANTVDTLVRRIFSKLKVDNRVEAALECVTRRYIEL